jgi:hypothetical protein
MADLADVEDALVTFVTAALYPQGTSQSCVVASECRVYRGWPLPAGLNADLAAGVTNVTVFPTPNASRVVTPLPITYPTGTPPSTFSARTVGEAATFVGTPAPYHYIGLLIDRTSYVYRPRSGDTAASVAAALALQVRADRIVQLSDTTLTIPGTSRLIVRIFSGQSLLHEVRRQERDIVVACWSPNPTLRDQVTATIDVSLACATFLQLSDGSSGRVRYKDTSEYDRAESALLYRRDLVYAVEYPTVVLQTDPPMMFGDLPIGAVKIIV